MGQISATYASPGLRHGLLHEDFPDHEVVYSEERGTTLGIPDNFGGGGMFCVATIHFGVPGKSPVQGWKPLPGGGGDPDQWLVLCTKALGRALKRAGYPGDTVDLKALVAWRNRNAEIGAIESGHVTQALSAPSQAALGAGAPDPVAEAIEAAAESNATRARDDEGDEPVEGVVLPSAEDLAMLTDLVAGLSPKDRATLVGYLETIGVSDPDLDDLSGLSASQVNDALDWLDPDHDAG